LQAYANIFLGAVQGDAGFAEFAIQSIHYAFPVFPRLPLRFLTEAANQSHT
jgi:hypothetical protein